VQLDLLQRYSRTTNTTSNLMWWGQIRFVMHRFILSDTAILWFAWPDTVPSLHLSMRSCKKTSSNEPLLDRKATR